jgi:phage-related protein
VEIFKLFGSIFVNSDEAEKSISRTEEKAESLGSKLGNGIKTAAKWGTAIVSGATAAVGGLLAVTNQTAEYADEIDKLSERTSINREELQRWKYAASQSGADIGKLEVGIKTLSGYMDDAMNGSKKATEAFAALGISVDDLRNKSQEEIFEEVMNSLGDMEQGAVRNAIGADLLGRSYTELLPLLNAGSSGMQELKDRADELGLVMSEDAVVANVTFGDTLQDIQESFGGIVRGLTNSFLPMLQKFADFIVANMPMIHEMVSGVFNGIGESVEAVLPFLMDLIQNNLPPLIDLFSQISSEILPPVITLFTDIIQTVLPPLIDLFTQIATDILPIVSILFGDFATNVLPPLVDLLMNIVSSILPPFIDLFQLFLGDILPPLLDLFYDFINLVLPPLTELLTVVIDTLLPPLTELFGELIYSLMPPLLELFDQFNQHVLPPLMELIDEVVKVILPPLLDLFMELADIVLPLVIEVVEALMPVIEPAMKAISAIIKTILAIIKGDWEGAWNGIKEFFSSFVDYIVAIVEGFKKTFTAIFEAIGKLVSGIWDNMVNNIKNAINFIINGINFFIEGLNKLKVPDWVPGVGGKGINIKPIPLLAEGGEILERGHAIVGETGPELLELPRGARVAPLAAAGGIIIQIIEPHLFNSRDADKLGDLIANRIRQKTGLKI